MAAASSALVFGERFGTRRLLGMALMPAGLAVIVGGGASGAEEDRSGGGGGRP